MIKIIEGNDSVIADPEQTAYLKASLRKVILTWKQFEHNFSEDINKKLNYLASTK